MVAWISIPWLLRQTRRLSFISPFSVPMDWLNTQVGLDSTTCHNQFLSHARWMSMGFDTIFRARTKRNLASRRSRAETLEQPHMIIWHRACLTALTSILRLKHDVT